MLYLELFWIFLQIGLLSIGGGYAAIPIIFNFTVSKYGWITQGEFTDLIAIAESTPGPIGVNAAAFVGMRTAGISGAIIATLGFALPGFIIVLILAYIYYRFKNLSAIQNVLSGLRPAIAALIASAGLSMLLFAVWGASSYADFSFKNTEVISLISFTLALIALKRFKPNPIFVMFACGLIGLAVSLIPFA